MSDTKKTPTTSSHIPRAGAALPGPLRPACNRGRGSATPGPVIPPDPSLPRNGSARGRSKGPAKYAGPTAGPMTTGVLSSTAIRQIRALALGEQLQPAIRTETEAQAAHAALVHEIFSALRSALVRRVGNPPGPQAAPGHRTRSDDAQPHTRGASPAPAMRKAGEDTTAAGSPPPTRGPGDGRHTNGCALGHKPRGPRASQPRPKPPLVQPNNTQPRNTPQQRLSVGHTDGKDVNLPETGKRYSKSGA